ncbi:MAG TPA: hypothetical protein VKH37_00145 [Ferruginibacter sp.]|nr:hypothetical protein [Ferruginibacter sp.]
MSLEGVPAIFIRSNYVVTITYYNSFYSFAPDSTRPFSFFSFPVNMDAGNWLAITNPPASEAA